MKTARKEFTTNQTNPEQHIIAGIRNHDERTILKIYVDYQQRIVNLAMKNSGSPEDGEDLFQETMIALYRMIQNKPLMAMTCKFSTLLYAIAIRIWRKTLRERKSERNMITMIGREEYINEMDPEISIIIAEMNDEQSSRFRRAYEKLPAKIQKILMQHYAEGIPLKQIAEQQGFTYAYTRVAMMRGRNKLRDIYQSTYEKQTPEGRIVAASAKAS